MRTRRIYAMCPPTFTKIGNECYHLSASKASWLDSHFECKDKNAKLAEPLKYSDRFLRKYLLQRGKTRGEIWIGGMYNWQRHKWQWGYNGKDMTYQSFSQMKPGEDLKYNCAVLNPELKYRWSAKLCFEKHYYLCQHRMPFVSEKNRQRIYTKWNETFPGQMANEIQVYVPPANGNRRGVQQRNGGRRPPTSQPELQQQQPQQQQQRKSQHPKSQNPQRNNQWPVDTRLNRHNEINPPEVLSAQDSQLRRKKQQKKDNRTIILTGNVDLGENVFRKSKQLVNRKRPNLKSSSGVVATTASAAPPTTTARAATTTTTVAATTTTTSTTQNPVRASENYHTNHHRHNHYTTEDERRRVADARQRTSTMKPTTERVASSASSYQQQESDTTAIRDRQLEKKKRLENIREKLSRLSDEEKMEYLKLKAQRKAQRSKSINDTIP